MLRSTHTEHDADAFEQKDGNTPDPATIAGQVKDLVEAQGRAFEEFKKAHDAEIAEIKKSGAASAETAAKVAKLNDELTRIGNEARGRIDEIEKKANRPQLGGEAPEVEARALKSFNLSVKAHANRLGRTVPADVDAEGFGAYKRAFEGFLRKGGMDMTAEERKALTVGHDPDGGYLCPPEVDGAIDRVVSSLGVMRSIATVRTIGAVSFKKLVTTTGASAGGWGGETTAPSETNTPKLAELEFTPGLLWAEPRATAQQLEDSAFDAEAWLADEVGIAFTEQEGDAFIDGIGVNKPRGFLGYDFVANASYAWGKIGYIASGAASDFASSNPSDKLIDLQHALKRQYRPGAVWVMNDATLGKIRKFKDGQGNYMWKPGLQEGVVELLLGKPVETDDFMPDVGADAYPVAFGDFRRGYLIVDRRGTSVIRDNLTSKPYVKFYTTRRVGGGIQNYEALKVLKIAVS